MDAFQDFIKFQKIFAHLKQTLQSTEWCFAKEATINAANLCTVQYTKLYKIWPAT